MHYDRWLRHGDPADPPVRTCDIANCGRRHKANGMCSLHYSRTRTGNSVQPDVLDLPGEHWRLIPGYERFYEVSDLGRVRTVARPIGYRSGIWDVKILRARPHVGGYLNACLRRDGNKKTFKVHRLVLEAFVGPCPEGMECRHLNGNPADNRLANLVWGSKSQNELDKVHHGTNWCTAKTHCVRNHPLSGPNLLRIPSRPTRRDCRACRKAHPYVWKWRQKGVHLDMQVVSDKYYAEIMSAA